MFTISCLKRLPNPPLIFQQKLDSKTLHSSCCFLRSGAESQLSRLTLRSHSPPTLLPSLPAPPRPRLPSTDLAPLSTSDYPSLRYPVSLQLRCAITDNSKTRQGIEGKNVRGKNGNFSILLSNFISLTVTLFMPSLSSSFKVNPFFCFSSRVLSILSFISSSASFWRHS